MIRDLIYDGTFEGLLTAIFYAYPLKDEVSISKEGCYTPTLISSPEHITTEEDKFNRVYKSIKNKLSYDTLSNVYLLFLSEVPEVENLILKYLKLCLSLIHIFFSFFSIYKTSCNNIRAGNYCEAVSINGNNYCNHSILGKIFSIP